MSILRDAHKSHEWFLDDDVMDCVHCGCRIYSDKAKEMCPEKHGLGEMLSSPFMVGIKAWCRCGKRFAAYNVDQIREDYDQHLQGILRKNDLDVHLHGDPAQGKWWVE